MVFGEIKNWQLDPNTKQILVFSCIELKNIFDHSYAAMVATLGEAYASDSNLGAIYKLRATKQIDGNWMPQVLCGITGFSIWEDRGIYESYNKAISSAAHRLGINSLKLGSDLYEMLMCNTTGETSKEAD